MAQTDTCVFCQATGTDFRPEHWVPQWVSRGAIPKGKGIEHHVPGRAPWLNRIVDLTVEHVCPDCNHHWMSDIETRARDIALPLIRGDETPRTFTAKQQELLATWCFLKAITLELGRPAYEVKTHPREMYTGLKKFGHPPNGSLITVGLRDMPEDPPIFVWFKSEGRQHTLPGVGHVGGYRTALTINHLVIDIVGIFIAAPLEMDNTDNRAVQIWPAVTEPLNWPPPVWFKGIVNNDLV